MKLQNLIIIFIIIIIPIVSIFSLYLNLETKTITMQTAYDEKLIEATKEAMEAFEINTVEWNSEYSSLANSKRQDLTSTINVFSSSLANKIGISGSSKENILTYVPAIVFTMYDGYYIYSPTYVPQTITNEKGIQLFYYENSGSEGSKITISATQNIGGTIFAGKPIYFAKNGQGISGKFNGEDLYFTTDVTKAEKTYKHVLKTFVPYTKTYDDYVINYTLDNYIRIYGKLQSKEGYVIDGFGTNNTIEIPVKNVSGIKVNGYDILAETLTENIYVKENGTVSELKTYPYIYNSNNDKRYYDVANGKFFTLNTKNQKIYIPDAEIGGTLAEYKKVLVRTDNTSWNYIELYQLINNDNNDWYYIDNNNQYIKYDYQPAIDREKDCSAINYYVATCEFNHWLIDNNIDVNTILKEKTEAIITNINNNLNLSISNYSANSKIDYQIPELTEKDWQQALSNISMITFFQGKKIGLKKYNNYAIVTSTENNEFVSEDSLYYIGEAGDNYYHRYYCDKGVPKTLRAYRNTEFRIQKYEENDQIKYYYKHYGSTENVYDYECFDCIVNRNNYTKVTNASNISYYDRAFYEALGRERYIQTQRTKLINR